MDVTRPRHQGAQPLTRRDADEVRTRTRQVCLAVGMLVSGTANTLTCKATLSTIAAGQPFDHPFILAACMFCGEILCLAWHVATTCRKSRRSKAAQMPARHLFALPALCDILGTSIMYVGLTLTSASTYQMLRGSVIIFTGALSAAYLKRRQRSYHWMAYALVSAGVLTVGTAAALQAGGGATAGARPGAGALVGNVLVVLSQGFTALQMVVEERFVTGYSVPALLAVGWEGIWGLGGVACLLVALQHTSGPTGAPVEDSLLAVRQIRAQPRLLLLMGANALSIAFFNFFGMSITKSSSAAYRMILDSMRTLVVWLIDLATGGGTFHPLQLVGFSLMFAGTALYNETVRAPCFEYPSEAERQEAREALASQRSRAQALLGEVSASAHDPVGVPLRLVAPPKPSPPPPPRIDDLLTPTLSRFTMTRHS